MPKSMPRALPLLRALLLTYVSERCVWKSSCGITRGATSRVFRARSDERQICFECYTTGPEKERSQNRDGGSLKELLPSERVDEVDLLTLENRFLGSRARDGFRRRGRIVHQVRVERASKPHRVLRGGVFLQFPQSIEAILQNVGGSPLVAFPERGNNCVLLDPPPGVADLHIIFVLDLAHAEVGTISLVLLAKSSGFSLCVQRSRRRIQVLLILQHQVYRQTRQTRLERIVQDEIGVQKVGQEVRRDRRSRRVGGDERGIGHAVGRPHARRQRDIAENRLAARTFSRHLA